VKCTVESWPWAWRTGDSLEAVPPALGTRLRMELELLLDREPWEKALQLLRAWSAMPLLDPCLQTDRRLIRRLYQASRLGLSTMTALVAASSDPLQLGSRLQVPLHQQRLLEALIELRCWIDAERLPQPWKKWNALEWTSRLERERWPVEAVALAVTDNYLCRRPLLRWWGCWRHVTSPVSAHELIAQGTPPGPELGEALCRRREQELRKMR